MKKALVCLAASLCFAQGAQAQPVSAGPVDPKLIEELIIANRILAMENIVDAMGHVSIRHPNNPNRYIISLARAPQLVTAADLMEYDLDSVPVRDPGRRQYSERYIHGEIYKLRPDVNAVIHNHSPAAIPFGVSSVPLRAVAHSGGFLAEGIPVYEIRDSGGETDMLVSNAAFGRDLAKKLGNKQAILLRGHGVAVVGQSLPYVVGRAIYLERGAQMQMDAIALGGKVNYLSVDEGRKIEARRDYIRAWELWKLKATGGK